MTTEDVLAGYAAGDFTAVELTRAFLARISRYEQHYNAFISMNPDALAIAVALIFRRVLIALFLGILSGAVLMAQTAQVWETYGYDLAKTNHYAQPVAPARRGDGGAQPRSDPRRGRIVAYGNK